MSGSATRFERVGLLAGALAIAAPFAMVAGCGGEGVPVEADVSAGTFAGAPLLQITSTGQHYSFAVRTSPQPPQRGLGSAQLTITDANGVPASDLVLAVTPWMPDMGHGSSVKPTVTAKGGGVYLVEDLYFFMPGRWQLRTHLEGGSPDDAAPEFQIE